MTALGPVVRVALPTARVIARMLRQFAPVSLTDEERSALLEFGKRLAEAESRKGK